MYRIVYPHASKSLFSDRSSLTIIKDGDTMEFAKQNGIKPDFASRKEFQDYDDAYAYAKHLAQLYGLSLHTPTAILD